MKWPKFGLATGKCSCVYRKHIIRRNVLCQPFILFLCTVVKCMKKVKNWPNICHTLKNSLSLSLLAPPMLERITSFNSYARNSPAIGASSMFSLSLRATGARPPIQDESQVTWLFQTTIAEDGPKYTTSLSGDTMTLDVRDVTLSDSGEYLVNVSHPAGARTLVFNVQVLGE